MKKISIIVPVFNVEEYLERCIESLVVQSYSNIEIILVDDGSTDNSPKICDEWAKKDKRIKVFHKKNGGLSDARNYGIKHASGDYLGFVDSDDWVDKNMFYALIEGCEKYKKDIGCCNKCRVYKSRTVQERLIVSNEAVDVNGAFKYLFLKLDPSACNKLFKKELFSDISFPKGKLYEDIGAIPFVIGKSNGIYLNEKNGYYYNLLNNNSIVHKGFNKRKMDYFYNAKKVDGFIRQRHKELEKESNSFLVLSITALLTDLYPYRKKYSKEYELLLRELRTSHYRSNPFIPFSKKVMIFLDIHKMCWLVNFIKGVKKP